MDQLTIDVGTTQIKLTLFKEQERVKEIKRPVKTYREKNGKVYQFPSDIVTSIKKGIKELATEGTLIEEILFSTAMHSVMPVFETNEKEELYVWLDQRPSEWVKEFKKNEELATRFYQKTGTPIHEMSPFSKIGCFSQEHWFERVIKWNGLKEYLMEAFTGQEVLDYSVASATGLFNSELKIWDPEILAYLTVDVNQLPKLVDTDWWALISPALVKELDLSEKTKIYVGASDGCLASLGSFISSGTSSTLTIGTSGAVRKLTKHRQLDEHGQTFCYYISPDYWVIGGATNNGGNVLGWASELLYESSIIFDKINDILTASPIGSNGILFLPYLSGERAPLWSSDVTGNFLGLRLTHTKEDVARSTIEGILFNLKWISEIVDLESRPVALSGGFFGNPILAELTADILGINCLISPYSEPSYGLICLMNEQKSQLHINNQRIFYNQENKINYESFYKNFLKEVKSEL